MCIIVIYGSRKAGKSWFVRKYPFVYIKGLYGGQPQIL